MRGIVRGSARRPGRIVAGSRRAKLGGLCGTDGTEVVAAVSEATTRAAADLPITGERTVPRVPHENYWFRRHEAAYLATLPWVRGAVVLEAGCGEGYGAALLARHARRVVAVDGDEPTVRHVRARYGAVTHPLRADLTRLPLADASVEVIVCLQVIEHVGRQDDLVAECARVLRPGGVLVVSTPNRLTFSPGRDRPVNPFHTRELSPGELADLLRPTFRVARLLGTWHGRRLRGLDARHDGDLVAAQLAAPQDKWSPRLRRDVAAVRARDFVVRGGDVMTCLDLLAVAVAES
jgi:SAM-dependent methyltransferase